jgi:glycosyltransferase involved in cell wall biosynthesis
MAVLHTPAVRSCLASGRFDACIVNGWYLKSYLQAIRSCRALGMPVLVRGDSHLKGRGRTVRSVVKYLPYRWMLKQIDAHLYVGRANYAYLRHFGVPVERLFFAPHFVENERFRTRADQARRDGTVAAIRRSLGATTESVVFLFAGKLIAGKRAADFIHATAETARRDGHVRGIVVGSAENSAEPGRGAGSPVTFMI